MRASIALLLALPPTFLSALVAASPSPILNQDPFGTSHSTSQLLPQSPRWRKLTDYLIDAVWGSDYASNERDGSAPRPSYSLAKYANDVVLRFNVSSAEEVRALADAADTLLLDVWEFSQNWVDLRLSVDTVTPLLGMLPDSLQRSHTPLLKGRDLAQAALGTYPSFSESLQTAARHERQIFSPALQAGNGPENNIFFSDYQPLSVVYPWMRLMSTLFRTHVQLINVGKSHQGRDIHGLRVGVHPTNDQVKDPPKRKTILINGGLHAREWIGISTVNYIAYSLITGYGKFPETTRLLEDFDFVFVPTINPDGYVYTWETDRLWRKNRQDTGNRFCQGIDLDRSFGFKWDGLTTTIGNPCSESYAGQDPFDAVEAQALADWARTEQAQNNAEFVGFLDLHSYSQEILFPYSYSCEDTPPGLENLQELAFGLEKAIRVTHGHEYEVMPACEGNVARTRASSGPASAKPGPGPEPDKTAFGPRMEAAGGSALDYFYHEIGVRYAYQLKLRDKGTYGFLLPKENIVPTGKEILEAVLYFGNFLAEVYEQRRGGGGGGAVDAPRAEVADEGVPQTELRRRRR